MVGGLALVCSLLLVALVCLGGELALWFVWILMIAGCVVGCLVLVFCVCVGLVVLRSVLVCVELV